MCRYCINPFRQFNPDWNDDISSAFESIDIFDLHRSLPEYAPTPLVSLSNLASRLGVGKILIKDESHRFGLKAFKALGASYAIYRLLKRDRKRTPSEEFELTGSQSQMRKTLPELAKNLATYLGK